MDVLLDSTLVVHTHRSANGARYESQGKATKERRPWIVSPIHGVSPEGAE